MYKKAFFIFYILCSFTTIGQTNNLCGIWFGYGYQCENIGPGGWTTFYTVPYEIISITQQGSYTTATKVVGDNCVTSGNITWEGYDTAADFNVLVTVGSPISPNAAQEPVTIFVTDSTHINLGYMHYVKASCTQVDSMSYLFNNNDVACLTCSFLNMPNVFTPNNDGINDVFLPVIAKNIVDYSLRIYSRWGQQVFFSSDFTQGWNGKIGTQDASAGVYYWICDYKGTSGSSQNKKGFLELIR